MVCVSNFDSVGLSSSHAICKSTCFSPALKQHVVSTANRLHHFLLKNLFDIICFVGNRVCGQGESQSNSDVVIIQFPIGLSLICRYFVGYPGIQSHVWRHLITNFSLNAGVVITISVIPAKSSCEKCNIWIGRKTVAEFKIPARNNPFVVIGVVSVYGFGSCTGDIPIVGQA